MQDNEHVLELGLQELEALEAPSANTVTKTVIVYTIVADTIAIVSTIVVAT